MFALDMCRQMAPPKIAREEQSSDDVRGMSSKMALASRLHRSPGRRLSPVSPPPRRKESKAFAEPARIIMRQSSRAAPSPNHFPFCRFMVSSFVYTTSKNVLRYHSGRHASATTPSASPARPRDVESLPLRPASSDLRRRDCWRVDDA